MLLAAAFCGCCLAGTVWTADAAELGHRWRNLIHLLRCCCHCRCSAAGLAAAQNAGADLVDSRKRNTRRGWFDMNWQPVSRKSEQSTKSIACKTTNKHVWTDKVHGLGQMRRVGVTQRTMISLALTLALALASRSLGSLQWYNRLLTANCCAREIDYLTKGTVSMCKHGTIHD